MSALIVYDSVHGNTEQIAQAIGDAIAGEVHVLRPTQVDPSELRSFDLVIVGAPTYGGRPRQPIQDFLRQVPASGLQGVGVAAFDTRIPAKWVRIFGFAAPKIARRLEKLGGTLVGLAEGFFVRDTEGPLVEGELERAADWARGLAEAQQ